MLNVRELIRELEKMPGDAKVLVHVKELGGFQRVEKVDLEDAKGFEFVDVEQVVILDEKPFVPRKKHQEEEQLCPGCNVAYCQGRYTTGQCE